jgi:hypothetical protein
MSQEKEKLQNSIRLERVHSLKERDNSSLSLTIQLKKKERMLKDELKHIILQRQNSKREDYLMNKIQAQQSIEHQKQLLDKLENDQHNNMKVYVKDRVLNLNKTEKPNLAVTSKQVDKKFNDYVHQQIKNKQMQENMAYNLRETIRKKKLKEIQEYQKVQMSEKNNIKRVSLDHEKLVAKDIIARDLHFMNTFDSAEKAHRLSKINQSKKLLDDQIRMDNEHRLGNLGIEGKEYALNAYRIRKIIEKY